MSDSAKVFAAMFILALVYLIVGFVFNFAFALAIIIFVPLTVFSTKLAADMRMTAKVRAGK